MALIDKLYAIGDAIRERTGKTDLIPLDDMPAEIKAIGGGGSSINDGDAYILLTVKLATSSGSLDLSDYISNLSQITSIYACGQFTSAEVNGTAYWNRSISPEGYADIFYGTMPILYRREASKFQWTVIDGETSNTTLNFKNGVGSTQFNKFLIRYNSEV